jgi:signal transduction histidine kinase
LFCFGLLIVDIIIVSFLIRPSDFLWWPTVGPSFARTAAMTLVGYILIRLIDGQRAQRHALAEANVKLRQYASTVEQLSISHERNRLARELHDTLAHTLSATSVQLEAVDAVWDTSPNQARELLHKSLAQTRSGLTETRRALKLCGPHR